MPSYIIYLTVLVNSPHYSNICADIISLPIYTRTSVPYMFFLKYITDLLAIWMHMSYYASIILKGILVYLF